MAAPASGAERYDGVESGPALRTSALSLTFPPATEQAFLQTRLKAMRTGIATMSMLMGLVLLLLGARAFLEESFKGESRQCWTCTYHLVGSVLFFLVAAAMRMPRIESLIGFRTCECVVMVVYLILLLILMFPLRWATSLDKGIYPTTRPPSREKAVRWEYERALTLDAIVTATHLVLPIRWKVIVWADLLYMFGFCIRGAIIGFPYDDLRFSMNFEMTVAALVVGASYGLRIQESARRELFSGLIHERTQKVLAQAAAEQGGRRGFPWRRQVSQDRASAHDSSAPETTHTGALFSALQNNGTGGATSEQAIADRHDMQLDILKELGVQEHWLIPMENLTIDFPMNVLGRGGYGMVVQGAYCGAAVAVKTVSKIGAIGNSLVNELRFLRQLRHPNLVTFFGIAMREGTLFVVMELIAGETLREYVIAPRRDLRRNGSATMSPCPQQGEAMGGVQIVMRGVVQALIFLHSQKPAVVHCDLQPANIIITQDPHTGPFAKLVDFGFAAAGTRHATVDGGTAMFMAPEAYSAEGRAMARPSVDIYAVGRLLCYAASLGTCVEVPEPGSAKSSPLLEAWTPLIMPCLSHDPSQRPTARDLDARLAEQIDPDPAAQWSIDLPAPGICAL